MARYPLAGRDVVVTGGSSGIGAALVAAAAGRGARVLTCGRDPGRLDAVATRGAGVTAVAADLATAGGRAAFAAAVEGWTDRLHLLVNNAALQHPHVVDGSLDPRQLEEEVQANLVAPIELSLRLVALMDPADAPAIANVTSIVGVVPRGRAPVYSATKAGLRGYTRALRERLAPRGIRVVEVLPPLTDTPMAAAVPLPKRSPATFAAHVIDAVEAGRPTASLGPNRLWLRLADGAPALAGRWVK